MGADKDFCNKLIEAVKVEQGLYVKSDIKYKDTEARRAAWQRVGTKLSESSEVCEHRWRLMRVRYGRVLHAKRLLGDKAPRYLTSWPFFSKLQFLRKHVQPRKSLRRRSSSSEAAFMLDTEDSVGDNSLEFMPMKKKTGVNIEEQSINSMNAADSAGEYSLEFMPMKEEAEVNIEEQSIYRMHAAADCVDNREQFAAREKEAFEELRGVIDTFKARINEADEDEAFLKNLAIMMRPLCQRTRENLKQQMFEKVMEARRAELVG